MITYPENRHPLKMQWGLVHIFVHFDCVFNNHKSLTLPTDFSEKTQNFNFTLVKLLWSKLVLTVNIRFQNTGFDRNS